MIVDLDRFVAAGRPRWRELEGRLDRFERDPDAVRTLAEIERLFELYEHAAADLARLSAFAAPPAVRDYLEALVARAYAEIHSARRREGRFAPLAFVLAGIPRAFRRRAGAFLLALGATLAGALFGAAALAFDDEAKGVLVPFAHLLGDPAERVREEESAKLPGVAGHGASFSAMLVAHNTRVALTSLALGMTWGLGTLIVLFYNGVVLGAVVLDYLRAGEGLFLAGWLLPHGVVEIPAFLIAGQAGLVLAGALLGRSDRAPLSARMRAAAPDLLALAAGFGLLLAWAALVEAFLSQLHEPVLPYAAKIGFGLVELAALVAWLAFAGRERRRESAA